MLLFYCPAGFKSLMLSLELLRISSFVGNSGLEQKCTQSSQRSVCRLVQQNSQALGRFSSCLTRSGSFFPPHVHSGAVARAHMSDMRQSCSKLRTPSDPISPFNPWWEVRCLHSHDSPPPSLFCPPPARTNRLLLLFSVHGSPLLLCLRLHRKTAARGGRGNFPISGCGSRRCLGDKERRARRHLMLGLNLLAWIRILLYSNVS